MAHVIALSSMDFFMINKHLPAYERLPASLEGANELRLLMVFLVGPKRMFRGILIATNLTEHRFLGSLHVNSLDVHAQLPPRVVVFAAELARVVADVLVNALGVIHKLAVILELLSART